MMDNQKDKQKETNKECKCLLTDGRCKLKLNLQELNVNCSEKNKKQGLIKTCKLLKQAERDCGEYNIEKDECSEFEYYFGTNDVDKVIEDWLTGVDFSSSEDCAIGVHRYLEIEDKVEFIDVDDEE